MYTATAYLSPNISADALLNIGIVVEALITSDSPLCPPDIPIDSLDGGEPGDIVYTPINANGLTGISGGLP